LSSPALIERTTGTKLKINGMMALQDTLKKMKEAGGGLLFIDEAHQLEPDTDSEGKKIFWTIMDEMTSNPGKFFVVIAGYQKDVEKLISIDPGLPERFGQRFVFEDYTDEEVTKIYTSVIQKENFKASDPKWIRIVSRRIGRRRGTAGFANARAVQNSFDSALERQRSRLVDERRRGIQSDAHLLIRDDLLGPKATKESLLQGCDAYKELHKMRGLKSVKESIENIIKAAVENSDLEDNEQPLNQRLNLNRVFLGNPGTGKTTVAKLYAQIICKLGFLSKGEVVFKTASDFNGSVLGESAKVTLQILESARGCVLVIDEAYGLNPKSGFSSSDPYKVAVIDTLVEKVQVGEDIAVIMLGYKEKMEQMLLRDANEGLARRFNMSEAFQFEDYSDDDLFSILQGKAKSKGLKVSLESAREAVAVLAAQKKFPNFGNAGAVQNLIDNAVLRMQSRLRASGVSLGMGAPRELVKEDFSAPNQTEPPTDDELGPILADKRKTWTTAIANAKRRGTDFTEDLNFLFTGPPGTGKTTTARVVGRMLRSLELLQSEEVIETSIDDFVTGYAQQAAIKTEEIFNKALGRVLFIDEAYGLEKYPEVTDKITALLTDKKFKGKIAVVLAGYERDIFRMLQTNPGLSSRFSLRIPFHPWDIEKSLRTLIKVLEEESISVSAAALAYLRKHLPELMCDELQWSSGRDVITLSRAFRASLELGVDEVGERHAEAELFKFIQQRKAESRIKGEEKQVNPVKISLIDAPVMGAPAQTAAVPQTKIEQRIQEVKEDDGTSGDGLDIGKDQESPFWNGMDVKTELIPLNTALEKLGWDGEEKVNELTSSDPNADNVAPLLIELTKAGMKIDTAKAVVKKWIDAAELVRKQRHEAEVEARLRARKPIVQCQVCKRTANYWAPCPVAPKLIGYEDVELPQHRSLKNL
jgi:Cdc6-like AAA superfamily ATPase